jgi:hypothetical protein
MSQNITLATAIAPGPRLTGGAATVNGARVVTVTNAGDQSAPSVHVYISDDADPFAQQAISDDPGCDNEGSETLCTLGSLAPGASASVTLTAAATSTCEEGGDSTPTYFLAVLRRRQQLHLRRRAVLGARLPRPELAQPGATAGQRGWISPIGAKPSCGVSM